MDKQTTASKVAEHKIIKARTSIVQEGRLGIASMIVPLILKEVSESVCDTMATDGTHIFWCDKFVNKCDESELKFTLIHEALHCTWAHHLRREKRDPKLWNVACDYAINGELSRTGEISYWKMPEGALYKTEYVGKTADEIYAELEQKQKAEKQNGGSSDPSQDGDQDDNQNGSGKSDGKKEGDDLGNSNQGRPSDFGTAGGVWDAVNDKGKPLTKSENIDAQTELKNKVRVSESVDRACGKGDGENIFRGRLDGLDVEIANYLEKIQDWLVSVFPDETTWNRPHRNHIWRDTTYRSGNYLPSRKPSAMGGTLAIGIDVSGSTSAYLNGFCAQVQGLVEQCNITKVKVCFCATRVYKTEKDEWWDEFDIASGEKLELEPRGGGGTELTPIFNLLNDYTDDVADIQGIIIFTDGEFRPVAKDKEPSIPVLWASTDEIPNWYHKTDVNFGEVINLPPHCLRED